MSESSKLPRQLSHLAKVQDSKAAISPQKRGSSMRKSRNQPGQLSLDLYSDAIMAPKGLEDLVKEPTSFVDSPQIKMLSDENQVAATEFTR